MKKGWIWEGFGTLLLGGILAGYVPDFLLMRALAHGRESGLLERSVPPKIDRKNDARPQYALACSQYANGLSELTMHFGPQTASPAPHTLKFLRAMVDASRIPDYSAFADPDGLLGRDPQTQRLWVTAQALAILAKDESDLLAAARIGRHLGSGEDVESAGRRALLVPKVLDRAAKLNLSPSSRRRIAGAFGAPRAARETLRRHVATVVAEFEKNRKENGLSMGRVRAEAGYLRFWNDFFAQAPAGGSTFVSQVKAASLKIEEAENRGWQYAELDSIFPGSPPYWAGWAEAIERANGRLEAAR